MPEIARKLAAILAADIVGYSRLAGADEEGIVSRLRALRHELVDPVVAANGGRVFKTVGDGRMVEFGRANIGTLTAAGFQTDAAMARLADGEAAVTRALKLAPNHPAAHFVMGLLLVYSGRAGQGVSELERALALDRNLAAAHFGLASAKAFTGGAETAAAPLREALRLSPRDANVFIWLHLLGVIKQFLRADEEATVWYRRSIEANRNFPLPHFFLASALAHLGRLDEARAEVQIGLPLDPSFTIGRFHGYTAGSHPTYLAQREHIADGMRLAGVPEG